MLNKLYQTLLREREKVTQLKCCGLNLAKKKRFKLFLIMINYYALNLNTVIFIMGVLVC